MFGRGRLLDGYILRQTIGTLGAVVAIVMTFIKAIVLLSDADPRYPGVVALGIVCGWALVVIVLLILDRRLGYGFVDRWAGNLALKARSMTRPSPGWHFGPRLAPSAILAPRGWLFIQGERDVVGCVRTPILAVRKRCARRVRRQCCVRPRGRQAIGRSRRAARPKPGRPA